MKKIFVSDFDGTLTKKDFYKIMIDDYLGAEGKEYFENWKKENKIDVDFLNKIFSWIEVDASRYDELISKVNIDDFLNDFRDYLSEHSIDFMILSAGFDLYINDALKRLGIEDVRVVTNPGKYENKRLSMVPDENKTYHSKLFGVDKGKVVEELRDEYDLVYFAGDSEPDFHAAKNADYVFAKDELAELMDKEGLDYHSYENFKDIHRMLREW